jgi:hypothetical protein
MPTGGCVRFFNLRRLPALCAFSLQKGTQHIIGMESFLCRGQKKCLQFFFPQFFFARARKVQNVHWHVLAAAAAVLFAFLLPLAAATRTRSFEKAHCLCRERAERKANSFE